jgi:ADP-dependent NAD(P)H-hydrate dehydratase / NAD(P)H-hydrate epimerase
VTSTALYTTVQVRALDRLATTALGIASLTLMQRAGAAAFRELRRRWPAARRILVFCGSGNNGGDGYVIAKLARDAGFHVQIVATHPPRADSDAARAQSMWAQANDDRSTQTDDMHADVIVDALLGTGLGKPVEGEMRGWIDRINAASIPVLALDVPSGIDADTGSVKGTAVRADCTITFVAHKRGLFTGASVDHCGELVLDALGLPDTLYTSEKTDTRLLDLRELMSWLPSRPRDAHKGLFGHVLAIGGDHGMGGAIRLAGEAALRVGAGLVSVATRAEHVVSLNAARPELMAIGVSGMQELATQIKRATVLALGPGLGQRAWADALWHGAMDSGKPIVIDADALNLLARMPRECSPQTVLTPHPGEAARLLGTDTATIGADRYAAARELAKRYRAIVVLKGAGSIIANPHGDVAVCPWGNPGMASGGMGDVLTGVIAGLIAQGIDAWRAAQIGVALHAQAGDIAATEGQAGMVASDLFAPLRRLRNGLGTL